jgi:uncharacterized protein with PQ loop repeat
MTSLVIPAANALPLTDERPEPACGWTARRWPRPSQSPRTEPRSTMIAALGFAAATLSITVVWSQVWLSCRHGRTLGLSPTGSWPAVGLNLCWLTFGLLVGDGPQIATHAVVGAGNTAVLAALLRSQPQLRTRHQLRRTAARAAGLAALAAGSVVAVVLGAARAAVAAGLSAVVTLVGIVAALPQRLGILFDRTQDRSGMSPARWYLGAGSCASWMAYGWLLGQPTVWLSAGFGLVCAVATCAVLRAQRTAPRAVPRPAVAPRAVLAAA